MKINWICQRCHDLIDLCGCPEAKVREAKRLKSYEEWKRRREAKKLREGAK